MPRRGKGDTQPAMAPQGLPYGQNKALQEAQHAVPLPDNSAPVQPQASPQGGMEEVLKMAQAGPTPPPGGIRRPSNRPTEPVSAGLKFGPGPGPEALQARQRSQVAEVLHMIATTTNDPIIEGLARRTRRRY